MNASRQASFFVRQMALYTSFHRDPRNRATHFVGVPLIIVSLLLPMSFWRFEAIGMPLSFGIVFAVTTESDGRL